MSKEGSPPVQESQIQRTANNAEQQQNQFVEARENEQLGTFLGSSLHQSRRESINGSHGNQSFELARGGISGMALGTTSHQVITGSRLGRGNEIVMEEDGPSAFTLANDGMQEQPEVSDDGY
jgi:hypothetical protein